MIYKALSLVMAAIVVLVGCTTAPAATPTTAPAKATATTQPKAGETAKPAASPTAAAAPTKPASTGPSGSLTAAISNFGNENLDPVIGGLQTGALYWPVFEVLIGYDEKGTIIPRLAESWTLSPDGKAWTFKLKKGVKFHNGDEMTSADAKFSLERLSTQKSQSPWVTQYRRSIDRIETPDASTLVIYTKDLEMPFLLTAGGLIVMPKKYIEEKGEAYFAEHPIGTGPFKSVSLTRGTNAEYEAVNNHWRITPEFQKLTIKLVPEESTRLAMLKRGEIDITEISLDNVDDLKKAGFELRFGTYDMQPNEFFSGSWIESGGPGSDVKVRQALSLAVNRDELAKTFFKGYATPNARAVMAPYSWAYDPAWKPDPYDPAKAKQLLAEAGYPNKFKDPVITMWSAQVAGMGWMPQFVQIMSGYWEAIGVKTKITPVDNATLTSMAAANPIDAKIPGTARPFMGYTASNTTYHLLGTYGSTGIQALMKVPEFDAIYDSATRERDEAKRAQLFRDAVNKGHEQYVAIQTVNLKLTYAVSNKVGDWTAIAANLGTAFEGMRRK